MTATLESVVIPPTTEAEAEAESLPEEIPFSLEEGDIFGETMLNLLERKTQEYQKAAVLVKKKSPSDFQDEALEIAKSDAVWSSSTASIEQLETKLAELKEVKKVAFQSILSSLVDTYNQQNSVPEEAEANFKVAKEQFDVTRKLIAKERPDILNHVLKTYGISTRESSPRSASPNGDSSNRIRGFSFRSGGQTFDNAGTCGKVVGVTKEAFWDAFVAAQGTDNRKQWHSLTFTLNGKEIQADIKVTS